MVFKSLLEHLPKFLERLMEKEFPEIADNRVEIVASARIPGQEQR